MIERRYVTPASRDSTGPVAGFWASLGLPPEVAKQNLESCRLRVEAIDVKGAKELTAALNELGVNVVNRSPNLTVTLVNDYLDQRLAELNKQRVSDKTPWLLVQPSGVFPLVGPVFNPGESACWTCLFDRMIRNREIKGFLDRSPARAVATSPLVQNTFGASAIQFAAVEIAKAIASGFRTDLRNHIASFDLMGATIAKHYVAHRPQCPTCGSKKLQNPRRRAAADRYRFRHQVDHDQRRISLGVVAHHGFALPKARQPSHRRGHEAREDRSRSADEHQFLRAA